jgi:hypothetical protein
MLRRLAPVERPGHGGDFDDLWQRGRGQRRVLQVGGVVATVLAIAAAVVALPHLMDAPPSLEVAAQPAGCPVTIPTGDFVPPAPYAAEAPYDEDRRWYGTDELWTVLDADGDYGPRKSVWWSENFPGGQVEEQPPITVTWERLDQPDLPPIVSDRGTNVYTGPDGWFMIGGIDPDMPGCWRVTATYKGAQLSYVYHRPQGPTDA